MKINIMNIIKNVVKHEIWFILCCIVFEIIRVILFTNGGKGQYYSNFYLKRDFILFGGIIIVLMSIIQQIIKDTHEYHSHKKED